MVGSLEIPSETPEGAWVELVPLAADGEAILLRPGREEESEDGQASRPASSVAAPGPGQVGAPPTGGPNREDAAAAVPGASVGPADPGPLLVCAGATASAVACRVIQWEPELGPPEALAWEEGRPVRGAIERGPVPVEGARVAVALEDLPPGAGHPVVLPLGLGEDGALVREVSSSADGAFAIPPLAPGRYRLEIWLPGGRIDRSIGFEIAATSPDPLLLDTLEIGGGLGTIVAVRDPEGNAIDGAQVVARTWADPLRPETWQAETGPSGRVELAELPVGAPVEIDCTAPGHLAFGAEAEQAPPFVDCVLEPLATIVGRVVGPGGEVPSGTRVGAIPADAEPPTEGTEPKDVAVGAGGAFALEELRAGDWVLRVVAPGHEVRTDAVTLRPGEALDVGELGLRAGRAVVLRTVAEPGGEALAGVRVESVDPPGALSGVTDGEGLLTASLSTDRDVVLRAVGERHLVREVRIAPSAWRRDEPVRIGLVEAGWIAATALRGGPEEPCRSCSLVLEPIGEELVTDGEGVALSPPLEPGWYRVVRPALEHRGSQVLEQPDAETRDVRVRPGEVARVELAGEPAGIEVRVEPVGPTSRRLRIRSPGRETIVAPDPSGAYPIRRPDRHRLRLSLLVHRPDLAIEEEILLGALEIGDPRERVRFLLPGTRVTARLVRDGVPWTGAVELREVGSGPAPGEDGPEVRDPAARTRTDAHGRLDLRDTPPGVYVVRAAGFEAAIVSLAPGRPVDLGLVRLP